MKHEIEYLDEIHQYLVDGVIVPSVSELTAYALNEDMGLIPAATLKAAADFGTRIHALIEGCENEDFEDLRPVTEEEQEIIDGWIDLELFHDINPIKMEQIVATEDYAGRYDMLAIVNGEDTLIDIKTNRVYPKDHLEVQMGLYLNAMCRDLPCGCAWYNKTKGKWEYKKVTPISKEKCQEIVEAYRNVEKPPVLHEMIVNEEVYTPEETTKIKAFYALKKEVEQIEAKAKEKMLKVMKEGNIKSFENDDFKITYIEAGERQSVDTDKLKEDGLYQKYSKTSPVKEQVRITPRWLKA